MTYGRVRATTCSHTCYHTCYHTENHDEQRHTDNLLEHESKSHVEFLWRINIDGYHIKQKMVKKSRK